MFRLKKCGGLGACCRPGDVIDHEDVFKNHTPASITFWFKWFNYLHLFNVTIFIADLDIFTIPPT